MPILTSSDYRAHRKRPLNAKVLLQCEFENEIETYHTITDLVERWWDYGMDPAVLTPSMIEDRKRNRPKYVRECLSCGMKETLDRSHDEWVRWALRAMSQKTTEVMYDDY